MLKVVLDTNTLISSFFWKGKEFELFKRIEESKVKLFLNKEILEEIEDVLNRPKFKEAIENANTTSDQIMQKVISVSHFVLGPKLNINICRDPKDNKFLECSINGYVDHLVSGDKDLLSLKTYKNIKISRTSEILEIL